jgi:hypothetical protein
MVLVPDTWVLADIKTIGVLIKIHPETVLHWFPVSIFLHCGKSSGLP